MNGLNLAAVRRAQDALSILAPDAPEPRHMSRKEVRDYSISRMVNALTEGQPRRAGLEWDIHTRYIAEYGEVANLGQIYMPPEVLSRDLTAASAAGGGYLVSTGNTQGYIPALRNRSIVGRLGATILPGLVGNVTIPKVSTGATAGWLTNEATAATESTPTTGQALLTPKHCASYVEVSHQLVKQATPSVDQVLGDDLFNAVATAADLAALAGTGASGQPLGVVGTAGIGSVTGTSMAIAGVLEFQTDVGNALGANCGYVSDLTTAATLGARGLLGGTAQALWSGSLFEGRLGGFPAFATAQMSSGSLLFGNWSDLLVGLWNVPILEVNPFAAFSTGIVGMRVIVSTDIAVRRAGSFSLATSVT